MYENFVFREHTCIVFELLAMNLYELIQKNNYKGFSLRLIRKFAASILEVLDQLKKHQIIHCDLKPENILLKEKGRSGIKVSDFSSACYDQYQMYLYIQSRSYRAPEVIFGARYGYPIDIWSFGCILAELYTGNTLFPGIDEDDQIACFMEVLGMPPESFLKKSEKRYNFVSSKGFPRYCSVTQPDGETTWTDGKNGAGIVRVRPGQKKLVDALNKCPDAKFVDLISQCLQWEPGRRITPAQALKHEFILGDKAPPAAIEFPIAQSKSTTNNGNSHDQNGHNIRSYKDVKNRDPSSQLPKTKSYHR
jgi:dual specificity tyrosine-phosphorylation-regulated kinase 2/3/4